MSEKEKMTAEELREQIMDITVRYANNRAKIRSAGVTFYILSLTVDQCVKVIRTAVEKVLAVDPVTAMKNLEESIEENEKELATMRENREGSK